MKVTHIFKTYFPDTQGGLEEAIRQIARYTSSKGIENQVVTVSPKANPSVVSFPEAHVIRYRTSMDFLSTPVSFQLFKDYKRIIADSDILHLHFPWPFGEMNYLLRNDKKPSVVTYHSDIIKHALIKHLYRPLIHKFLNCVDVIVPTSENYLHSSRDLAPFKDKCRVINLTIDEERFSSLEKDILQEVKTKFGDDFFLFVGVLREYKGLDYLLEAMAGVKRKLVIVGKGREEKKLKQKAKKLGLNNVSFAGYVDDKYLPAFYTLCKALVFPSVDRSEAFGTSLLEASYFSKPMISTELKTGTSFINKHNITGFVIPPKRVGHLKRSMNLFSENDDLCRRFGDNAKIRFRQEFNAETSGNKYLEIYKDLAKKNTFQIKNTTFAT